MKALIITSALGIVSCLLPWTECGRYLGGTENALSHWPGAIIFINYMFVLAFSAISLTSKIEPHQKLIEVSSVIGFLAVLFIGYSLVTGWVLCKIQIGLVIAFFAQIILIIFLYRKMKG
ncbi:MAG: hypothetical protein MI810_09040 [Flavobacteriales bacterium]|nr:hypothetical protein [Flavobacteriales bacterium]